VELLKLAMCLFRMIVRISNG